LESILAEYKGSAFISGDKKTPPEILNEQAERILMEAAGSIAPGSLFSAETSARVKDSIREVRAAAAQDAQQFVPKTENKTRQAEKDEQFFVPVDEPSISDPGNEPTVIIKKAQEPQSGKTDEDDNVVLFFDNYRSKEPEQQDTIVRDVEKAIVKELGYGDEPKETGTRIFKPQTPYDFDEEEQEVLYEEFLEEPELKDAAGRFALACNSISLRCIPAGLISILMVMMTLAFEAGLAIPFGIGHNLYTATGSLMLCMLIVMILCSDIIVRGVGYLMRGAPNAETLLLFSCAFSFISAAFTMLSGASAVLPYCAISAHKIITTRSPSMSAPVAR